MNLYFMNLPLNLGVGIFCRGVGTFSGGRGVRAGIWRVGVQPPGKYVYAHYDSHYNIK